VSNRKTDQIKQDLEKSLKFLESALQREKDEYMIAAVIQAFELCVELSWKYMQSRLATDAGIIANSPKSSIREYGLAGYDIDVDVWLELITLRNLTVHTYNPEFAEDVYTQIAERFPSATKQILGITDLN
jgi:nucleotidyltransferase substrate binding protein (TIGR01987 family)